jgi:uncharacterized repeat protein (TIGR03803 family)
MLRGYFLVARLGGVILRIVSLIFCGVIFASCSHVTDSSPLPADVANGAPASQPLADRSFTSLYSFKGGKDGASPSGSLVNVKGNLYGTTGYGGTGCSNSGSSSGCGTVFELSASGTERVIYRFKGDPDGVAPDDLISMDGEFYGTTTDGGTSRFGTVFAVNPSTGTERVLHSFKGGVDGRSPGTIVALSGSIYGIAAGGKSGSGMIFEVTKSGEEHTVYSFKGNRDGGGPTGLVAVNDELYGTTSGGGKKDDGTAFVIDSGEKHTIYSFGANGMLPYGQLIYVNGKLYGSMFWGGAFVMTTLGKERVFCNKVYGVDISFMNDALYGTYDSSGYGIIYEMSMSGTARALYTFKGGRDGAGPHGPLLPVEGVLYGTAMGAGEHGYGTVYKVLP